MASAETIISTKTFLINPRGEALALLRSPSDEYRADQWDLPGGTVEPGETVLQAAAREVAEESGLGIDEANLSLAYTSVRPSRYGHVNRRHFLAGRVALELTDRVVLSSEHTDKRWVDWERLDTLIRHPAQRQAWRYMTGHGMLAVLMTGRQKTA